MTQKNNGGQFHLYHETTGEINIPGITCRDWLAGLAMQGILANSSLQYHPEDLAVSAYQSADAVIAESMQ